MGCKKKLIQQGLIDLFPKNIDTLYEPFSGSAIVSMNTIAKKYRLNDLNSHLLDLYKIFRLFSFDEIITHIESRIEEFSLARERTKKDNLNIMELRKEYKENYYKFRDFYNSSPKKDPRDFYLLMLYAFSQQFRFNADGHFNMPCGNDCWSAKYKNYIRNGIEFFNKDVNFSCIDFSDWINSKLEDFNKNDFVYLDPPYFSSMAVYNENRLSGTKGWTVDDETNLYRVCDELDRIGIKFGMSNVLVNKNKENVSLIEWSKRYNVHTFNKQTYVACGKGNSNAKEVFICNYKVENDIFDM